MLRKAYMVGTGEKHRIEFGVNWFTGMARLSCDGKTIRRAPFFLKWNRSLEIGDQARHVLHVYYNPYDFIGDRFVLTVDGQRYDEHRELNAHGSPDTPIDDAVATFLFVAAVNVVFSVIGTLFVPDLNSLEARLVLLMGALIYLLFAIRTLLHQSGALLIGTVFFVLDSSIHLSMHFGVGNLLVRLCVLYYLVMGIRFLNEKKESPEPAV